MELDSTNFIQQEKRNKRVSLSFIIIAFSILLLLVGGFYMYQQYKSGELSNLITKNSLSSKSSNVFTLPEIQAPTFTITCDGNETVYCDYINYEPHYDTEGEKDGTLFKIQVPFESKTLEKSTDGSVNIKADDSLIIEEPIEEKPIDETPIDSKVEYVYDIPSQLKFRTGDELKLEEPLPRELVKVDSESKIETFESGDTYKFEFFLPLGVTYAHIGETSIVIISPTPSNNFQTYNNSIAVAFNITNASDLGRVLFNWNGTNYTHYDNSLVLLLNLNNVSALQESSSKVTDVSLFSNNGTPQGNAIANTNGRYLGAYNFSGAGLINISNSDSLNIVGDQITVSYWVKTTKKKVPQISKGYGYGGYYTYIGTFGSDGRTSFAVNTSGTFKEKYIESGDVSDGQWHHFIGTYNGTEISVYLDGQYKGSKAATGNIGSTNRNFYVGYLESLNLYYNGMLDEVRVWNTSISHTQARQIYFSNLNKYSSENWNFLTNQTNLTVGNYTYYGCARDILLNENCTSERNFTVLPISNPSISNPSITSLVEFPTDPTTYSPNKQYIFQANVLDTIGLDTVLLEFDGINYTASLSLPPTYEVTLTDLPAGTFNYKWIANNTLGGVNSTEGGTYTIDKNSSYLGSISGGGVFEYPHQSTVTGSESNSGDGDVVYTLFRGTIAVSNPDTQTLGVADHLYKFNATEGQNYSAIQLDGSSVNITQNNSYSLALDFSPSDSVTNGTETTVTGLYCPETPYTLSCGLWRDGSSVSNPDVDTLPVGTYAYIFNTTGDENYSIGTTSGTLTVNLPSPSSNVTVSSTPQCSYKKFGYFNVRLPWFKQGGCI